MLLYLDGLFQLADEVLPLVAKRGQIEITDIQNMLGISKQTTDTVADFLVKFGFAEFDAEKRYIRLSKPCRKFFAEIT